MTVTDKDFRVKNGLSVAGDATFGSNVILGTTPIAFDTVSNRLKVYVNNAWSQIATLDDVNGQLTFMDIGLAIDYNGQPTYIVQGNGINISGDSKYADAGNPNTTNVNAVFDAGII